MSVPFDYHVRRIARQWGVPPWVVTGEEPTLATVSRWVTRELVYQRFED